MPISAYPACAQYLYELACEIGYPPPNSSGYYRPIRALTGDEFNQFCAEHPDAIEIDVVYWMWFGEAELRVSMSLSQTDPRLPARVRWLQEHDLISTRDEIGDWQDPSIAAAVPSAAAAETVLCVRDHDQGRAHERDASADVGADTDADEIQRPGERRRRRLGPFD
jgi:hypothetical protein